MRRPVILALALVMAMLAGPAEAQFALSPRGVLGAVTRPLREMLGHFRGLHRNHHVERGARHAPDGDQTKLTSVEPQSAVGADARQNAYDDILGFAFWPNDYDTALTRFGYDDIAVAIAGSLPAGSATDGSGRHRATTGQNSDAAGDGMAAICRNADASSSDWLVGRINRALHPDALHSQAFDQLRGRLDDGVKTIGASCRIPAPASPTARLAALRQRLWALHDADVLVRRDVEAFYATLTDAQKAKFTATVQASSSKQACAQGAGATERLLDQIAKNVKPTQAQQASLDNLRKTSSQMEQQLMASCGQPIPGDPMARLDAVDERLVAMNYAAASMEIALNDFYASLDATQKTRFDSLGR